MHLKEIFSHHKTHNYTHIVLVNNVIRTKKGKKANVNLLQVFQPMRDSTIVTVLMHFRFLPQARSTEFHTYRNCA